MSRYDQLVRHWEWADALWAIVRDSMSDEDFAKRLAAFSASVSAAVTPTQQGNEVRGIEPDGMNGTAFPQPIASEGVASPPLLDSDLP